LQLFCSLIFGVVLQLRRKKLTRQSVFDGPIFQNVPMLTMRIDVG
jgi:hypothetical protein